MGSAAAVPGVVRVRVRGGPRIDAVALVVETSSVDMDKRRIARSWDPEDG